MSKSEGKKKIFHVNKSQRQFTKIDVNSKNILGDKEIIIMINRLIIQEDIATSSTNEPNNIRAPK